MTFDQRLESFGGFFSQGMGTREPELEPTSDEEAELGEEQGLSHSFQGSLTQKTKRPEQIIQNVYPGLETGKDLKHMTEETSAEHLLRWGSRLELQSIELAQMYKALGDRLQMQQDKSVEIANTMKEAVKVIDAVASFSQATNSLSGSVGKLLGSFSTRNSTESLGAENSFIVEELKQHIDMRAKVSLTRAGKTEQMVKRLKEQVEECFQVDFEEISYLHNALKGYTTKGSADDALEAFSGQINSLRESLHSVQKDLQQIKIALQCPTIEGPNSPNETIDGAQPTHHVNKKLKTPRDTSPSATVEARATRSHISFRDSAIHDHMYYESKKIS